MTNHVDCVGTPTLFVHYDLTCCCCCWFGFAFLGRFSFGSHFGVSAQTAKVLVFAHSCLVLHCHPVWQQWTIQILCILWFGKGARKLQHVFFSRFFCSLTPHWSFLYLGIFMKHSVLCRAGLLCFVTEEWSQPLWPIVSGFPGFVSKLCTKTDRVVFGDGEGIFPFGSVLLAPLLKGKCMKREGMCRYWQSRLWCYSWYSDHQIRQTKLPVMFSKLVSIFHPASRELNVWQVTFTPLPAVFFCEFAAVHPSRWPS